jgi:hypothetical protein
MRQHSGRKKKKKKKKEDTWTAGSSQEDNKNRKKQVHFLLVGNAQNIFCKQEEKWDQSVPIRPAKKKKKRKEKEGDVGEGCGRHFSACFSNLVFTYKNKETPLERKAFSGRKTEYRTWRTAAPVTLVLLGFQFFSLQVLFRLILEGSCAVLLSLQPRFPFLVEKTQPRTWLDSSSSSR